MSSACGPQRPPILLKLPRRNRVTTTVVAGDAIEPEFPGITTGAGVGHPIRRHCP